MRADFSTQYTSYVRSLKVESTSPSSGGTAEAAGVEFTFALLVLDAFACVGFGTKDMQLPRAISLITAIPNLLKGSLQRLTCCKTIE